MIFCILKHITLSDDGGYDKCVNAGDEELTVTSNATAIPQSDRSAQQKQVSDIHSPSNHSEGAESMNVDVNVSSECAGPSMAEHGGKYLIFIPQIPELLIQI